ncbi:MAG TPA: EamA family transporter [Patescibacteria group bacterium]|nr:EamA family transporter [Patescibacteria group bacterium]
MWLLFSLLGYGLLAIVAILDKFIVSKTTIKPVMFTFYSTIFLLPLFLLLPFGVIFPPGILSYIIITLSGLTFLLALWTMYIAFRESEISHVGPLIGGVTPLFVLLLSRIFLNEQLSTIVLLGVFLLVLGSLLISFQPVRKHHSLSRGAGFAILASFFFAVSHLASKYLYDSLGFYSGLVWSRAAIGFFGALMLFIPAVRAGLRPGFSIRKLIPWRDKYNLGNLTLVTVDKVLGLLGVLAVQFAIAVGSVTVVNALNGFQYGLLIILVALLSWFFPKVFKEKYERGELWQEIAAVVLIGIGLSLFV